MFLVARYNRGEDSIKVYPGILDDSPYLAVRDETTPPMQRVEPIHSLARALVWLLEGFRPIDLCAACGGQGWRWGPDARGEADYDLCPACHGKGGTA